jgi:excisionase family DNA binding protein
VINKQETPKLLLTTKQAAIALNVCERTIWEWTKRGEIPRVKIGAAVRYHVRDLEAFIEKKKGGTA